MFFAITPKKSGPTIGPTVPASSSMLKRAMSWVVGGLGLPSNDVPSSLASDTIQGVVEMYRPALKSFFGPTSPVVAGFQDWIVPPGAYWEFVSLAFAFTSSAVAGNREITVAVNYNNGAGATGLSFIAGGNKVQAAGVSFFYSAGPHGVIGDTTVAPGRILIPMPIGMLIPSGWRVEVVDSAAIDTAGDAYTFMVLTVKEHPGAQVS